MEDAEEEFALFLKALLFLRCRISLLVRVDFPSILLNSTFVFERVFFFYRWQMDWDGVWPWLLLATDELAVKVFFLSSLDFCLVWRD